MAGLVDALVAVLNREAEELQRLRPLIEEQQRMLLRGDARAVVDALTRQEPVLHRIAALESERISVVAQLAALLDLDPKRLTLTHLLSLVPRPLAGLEPLRRDLRSLLDRLLTLNSRNTFLIERSLLHLERLFRHLLSALRVVPAPTYAASGRPALSNATLQFVDRRV